MSGISQVAGVGGGNQSTPLRVQRSRRCAGTRGRRRPWHRRSRLSGAGSEPRPGARTLNRKGREERGREGRGEGCVSLHIVMFFFSHCYFSYHKSFTIWYLQFKPQRGGSYFDVFVSGIENELLSIKVHWQRLLSSLESIWPR